MNNIINSIEMQNDNFRQEITRLPNDIQISTMTIVCRMNLIFNVNNIAKYIELNTCDIVSVNYGPFDDFTTNRSVISRKKNKQKNDKSFYNQVSLQVMTKHEHHNDKINITHGKSITNVKLFLNGSIQMTGCKSIECAIMSLKKVFYYLKQVKCIMNNDNGKMNIIEKNFVDTPQKISLINDHLDVCIEHHDDGLGDYDEYDEYDIFDNMYEEEEIIEMPKENKKHIHNNTVNNTINNTASSASSKTSNTYDTQENEIKMYTSKKNYYNEICSKLTLDYVTDFQISMINSNFVVDFKVDREKLYELLIKNNVTCVYDPAIHACVNIKYEQTDKTISIFVFESGSIIITGAKSCNHIVNAHTYICRILYKNYMQIKKYDPIDNNNIINFMKKINKSSQMSKQSDYIDN